MTYKEIEKIAKTGKLCKLPKFEGYFKWDYHTDSFIFYNNDFICKAEELDILNRTGFYYII